MGCHHSKALTRKGFIKFFESKNACQHICKEHEKLINAKIEGTFSASIAAGIQEGDSSQKRRLCFDHSRVILPEEENRCSYMNASCIDGFNRPMEYIVAESPNPETSEKFWRMIWENQAEIVVMFDMPGENGGYRYWSEEEGSSLQFGMLTVQTSTVITYSSYQITTLIVVHKSGGMLIVNHFMCQNWPKYYPAPLESEFFELINKVHLYRKEYVTPAKFKDFTSPVIVHSSNGLGRAMVFCAIDISISQFLATGRVNLFSTVSKLRKQRFDCLNNVAHYGFCYVTLYYYFTSLNCESGDTKEPRVGSGVLKLA